MSAVSIAFLRRVLPDTGPYALRSSWRKGGPPTRIEYAQSVEELWSKLDGYRHCDCYFTTGSLKDKSSPEAKNIAAKRAFYLDIDKDPEKALVDTLKFCKVVGLPPPAFVLSGRGVHAWWPLKEAIDQATWLLYAHRLKEACKAHGLAADPAVTSDIARILRCPGTFNHKNGSPVEVQPDHRCFKFGPYPLTVFDVLPNHVAIDTPEAPPAASPTTLYNELTAEYYGSMLASISKPESYGDALRVGMALHALGWGEPALEMWINWYEGSPEQQSASGLDRDQLAVKWQTFNDPAKREVVVTPGTLDHMAKEAGWSPPGPKPAAVISLPVYTPPPGADPDDPFIKHYAEVTAKGWEANAAGCPVKNSLRNARMGLVHLRVRARHNLVSNVSEVLWGGKWQRKTDDLVNEVEIKIMDASGADPGDKQVSKALDEIAKCIGPFNPIRDYLSKLSWDGEPRLDTWLMYYCGAKDSELYRFFGSTVLIAAVRRAINDRYVPFDNMLVLIGEQDLGKSAIVRKLGLGNAPDGYYKKQSIIWSDPRSATEVLRGCWFYEWADLSGHSRVDDNHIKSLLSSPTDEARLAYRRDTEAHIRRTIFIGTTNEDTFVKDQTGARRYWPVQMGTTRFLLDEFDNAIPQLYAEAVVRERTGVSLEVPAHLSNTAKEAQSKRTELPRLYDALLPVCGLKTLVDEYISTASIKARWLPGERPTPWLDRDIKEAMTKLGWTYCQRQINFVRQRGYVRPVREDTSGIQEPQSEVLSDPLGVCSPEVWAVPKVPTGLD
jgi:hypothetical protein